MEDDCTSARKIAWLAMPLLSIKLLAVGLGDFPTSGQLSFNTLRWYQHGVATPLTTVWRMVYWTDGNGHSAQS